jgi:hypothetical protein
MSRYVAMRGSRRPRADWEDQEPVIPELHVYEPEDATIDTGLVDAHGVKLYRVPVKIPFGFVKE